MAVFDYLNPFNLFRKYVRVPVETFARKQYLEYKLRTNKGINSAKEVLYRAAIVTLFVTAILWISVFMYVVFYYTYMPNVTHVRPVHLQFKSCEEQMGICSFPSAHVQLTKRSHMLMATQPYRIKLILDMPESQINKDLGSFWKQSVAASAAKMATAEERCSARLSRNTSLFQYVHGVCSDASKRRSACVIFMPFSNATAQYWTDLKNRTKGKMGTARRRSKFTGAPIKVNLNCWEQRIMELAELASKEPQLDHSYDENLDSTCSISDEKTQPIFESTPNTSQTVEQMLPIDMSNGHSLPEQMMYVSTDTQMSLQPSPTKHTAEYNLTPLQNVPLPPPSMGYTPNMTNGSSMHSSSQLHNTAGIRSGRTKVRSRLHQLLRTLVLAPLLLSGLNEEKQQLQVELFSDFEDDQNVPVTDAYVELQSRWAQVYACELHIEAHFQGLRYVMFHWPKVSALVGISTNLFFVSLIFILSWYHLQDGLPDFVKFQGKLVDTPVKEEDDAPLVGKLKLEREDSSNFFEEESLLEELQNMEHPTKT